MLADQHRLLPLLLAAWVELSSFLKCPASPCVPALPGLREAGSQLCGEVLGRGAE